MQDHTTLSKLKDEVSFAPAWRPEPGDTLAGVAVSWSPFSKIDPVSKETRECEILVIRDEAGAEHAVWCWHTVLRNDLVGKVKVGDLVAISYAGVRPRQSGDGKYHAYRVAIEAGADEAKGSQGDGIPW